MNLSDLFECEKCGECCKGYGGTFVTDRDIERISRFLNVEPRIFLKDYCQWSGSRPVIAMGETGYCVFWDRLCTIHEVKPRMCKIWPFIDGLIADPANWNAIKGNCPGVRREATREELTACVSQVLAQYDREMLGFKGSRTS